MAAFPKNIRQFREHMEKEEYPPIDIPQLISLCKSNPMSGIKSNADFARFLGLPERTLENWVSDGPNHREPPGYLVTLIAYTLYCADCFEIEDLMYDEIFF